MDDIEERVMKVLNEYLINDTSATATSQFKEDLGMDSLDVMEAIIAIEDEFNVLIPDADAEKWVAVSDIVNYLKTLKD